MAWAPIAAAGIGALGQLGAAGLGFAGNQQAAGQKPQTQTIPLPPYQDALNRITARALALNMMQTPPSFQDWVNSGGTAKFPIINPGITPKGAKDLGIVTGVGGQVPFVYGPGGTTIQNAGLGELSPEQQQYLGYQLSRSQNPNDRNNLQAKLFNKKRKQQQLEHGIPITLAQGKYKKWAKQSNKLGRVKQQETNLQRRISDLNDLISGGTGE